MGVELMNIRPCTTADASLLALVGSATFLEAFAGFIAGDAILAHCTKNHSVEAYTRYLAQPTARAWLAEVDPAIGTGPAPVGYALLTEPDFSPDLPQPGDLELKRIYVLSKFYGRTDGNGGAPGAGASWGLVPGPVAGRGSRPTAGPGQQMMELAIAHAEQQGAPRLLLGVHRENARALAFYRRNGFEQVGVRTFQLGSHVYDDFVLARTLQTDVRQPC